MPIQLKRRRSEGTSLFSNNALSKIVRLTIETNLLTSRRILSAQLWYTALSHRPHSATVAMTALVLFVLELVSSTLPVRNLTASVSVLWVTWYIEIESVLVLLPVSLI